MEIIKQNIITFGEDRGKPYAESSITTYLRNIKKMYNMAGGKDPMENMEWAKNVGAIETALNKFKPTTQRNYYNAIIIGLMAHPGEYADWQKIYEGKRDILNAEYEKNKGNPTEGQAKVLKDVNQDTILKMLDDQLANIQGNRMDHLCHMLFKIHTEYPFRNELAKIQIVQANQYPDVDKSQNYIMITKVGKGKRVQDHKLDFKLNDYKTSAKYGEKTIPVEGQIKMDILNWILKYCINDLNENVSIPTYLFTWATGKPLLRNDISHLMGNYSSKLIGHSVSTTLMAKIFNFIPDGNKATPEELAKVQQRANIRGHSVKMSASVYNPNL